ncbi:MAG: DUF3105 domain-containing protein [bacterium]|nr:DUF3105 domain-containing protein [bacterium]
MEEQTYQAIKEEKEARKEEDRGRKQRERQGRKIRGYIITGVIIAVLGYGIYVSIAGSAPQEEDYSRVIPIMGDEHIAVGGPLPEYNSNPPTSGPHYGQTAQSGFREEEIPDQHIIHNLEHGDIWISYHPRVSDEIRDELRKFAGPKVIITPREENDTDVAVVAWGRLDTFDIENNVLPYNRIGDFIKRYTNKGPEFIPGASGGI